MSSPDWMDDLYIDDDGPVESWPVECDCCHGTFMSDVMIVEEGDRWECVDCWEKLNAKERANEQGRTGA